MHRWLAAILVVFGSLNLCAECFAQRELMERIVVLGNAVEAGGPMIAIAYSGDALAGELLAANWRKSTIPGRRGDCGDQSAVEAKEAADCARRFVAESRRCLTTTRRTTTSHLCPRQ